MYVLRMYLCVLIIFDINYMNCFLGMDYPDGYAHVNGF
jgi:hypothetical protein